MTTRLPSSITMLSLKTPLPLVTLTLQPAGLSVHRFSEGVCVYVCMCMNMTLIHYVSLLFWHWSSYLMFYTSERQEVHNKMKRESVTITILVFHQFLYAIQSTHCVLSIIHFLCLNTLILKWNNKYYLKVSDLNWFHGIFHLCTPGKLFGYMLRIGVLLNDEMSSNVFWCI